MSSSIEQLTDYSPGSAAMAIHPPNVCCRCETSSTNYLDLYTQLWYSTRCCHALCHKCKTQLYAQHRVHNCPAQGCGTTLSIQNFTMETLEKRRLDEELRIRKRLRTIFNKRSIDFMKNKNITAASLSSTGLNSTSSTGEYIDEEAQKLYGDYTEKIEEYIYTLVYGSEQEKKMVEDYITKYRNENQYEISMNAVQAQAKAQADKERLALEIANREAIAKAAVENDINARKIAEKVKKQVMDVLLGETKQNNQDNKKALEIMKQKLLELQAQKRAAAMNPTVSKVDDPLSTSTLMMVDTNALQNNTSTMMRTIPCPTVFPPRFLSWSHSEWRELSLQQLEEISATLDLALMGLSSNTNSNNGNNNLPSSSSSISMMNQHKRTGGYQRQQRQQWSGREYLQETLFYDPMSSSNDNYVKMVTEEDSSSSVPTSSGMTIND